MTRRIVTRSNSLILLICLAVLLLTSAPALAHGYIIRAIPADRAALDRAPARVQFWFSEDLEPAFTRLTVRDASGAIVAEGGVDPRDGTLLSARLPADLPDGAYVSELRIAFAGDGHVIAATQAFFVGTAADGGIVTGQDETAVPAEVVWRALLLASTMALFGALVLYNVVLLPAWGSAAHPAGNLPPRVMARLDMLVIGALVLAALANSAALIQQSSVFFGAPIDRVLTEGLWNTVRISTRFGDTWNWRMLLLGIIALVHAAGLFYRRTQPGIIRAGWAANAWAGALLLGTWSVSSHAAGAQVLPWLALISDWLHGLSVGAWAGGALALVWVLPAALRPLADDARRLALLAALRRFSPLAVTCLALVITSGLYNAATWFTTPADAATPYGVALAVKSALVLILIGLGAAHHIALRPERFARWEAVRARVGGFLPTLRLEAAVVLLALVGAAWLSATPPPVPEIDQPPPLIARAALPDAEITLSLAPGGVGVNLYDVQVARGGSPVSDSGVQVRLAHPARDVRGAWLTADPLGDGLYSAAGGEIDRDGDWWALIALDGAQTAVPLAISADAALVRERPPSIVNLLALTALIGAIGMAIAPFARAYARKLDWSPAALAVAGLALVGGVIVVVVGLWATAASSEAFARTVQPPPEIVNPALPDADSLARGAEAFEARCAAWVGARDFTELTRWLDRLGDQALYAALGEGWRALPACAPADEALHWDMVNHLRARERPEPSSPAFAS
jgi:putative copper export protein/methionine-rich copper-binding protein CopC